MKPPSWMKVRRERVAAGFVTVDVEVSPEDVERIRRAYEARFRGPTPEAARFLTDEEIAEA